jgi:hypothetical protein
LGSPAVDGPKRAVSINRMNTFQSFKKFKTFKPFPPPLIPRDAGETGGGLNGA